MVRFLPRSENGPAGSMFNQLCERNGEKYKDGMDKQGKSTVEKKNSSLFNTVDQNTSTTIESGVTSKLCRLHRPEGFGFHQEV
jgi:hypothetical protein